MTQVNVSQLIATARRVRAQRINETGKILHSGYAVEGNVEVRVIPVQPRGMSSKWSERADVYIDGKRLKTAEVKEIIKAQS